MHPQIKTKQKKLTCGHVMAPKSPITLTYLEGKNVLHKGAEDDRYVSHVYLIEQENHLLTMYQITYDN